MILIYKHGNIDPERTRAYKIVCSGCGCEFYANNHDFKWSERSIDGKAGILCPDCGREIVFKPSNCMIDMHEDPNCMVFRDNVKEDSPPKANDIKNILKSIGDYCGSINSCDSGFFTFREEQIEKASQAIYDCMGNLYQYIIYDHFAFSDGDVYTQSNPYMYEKNCEEDAKNECNKLNDEVCEDGRYGYTISKIPIVDLQKRSIDEIHY